MSRLNRAAQFAPFAALTGYDDAIEEAARLTDGKIELSEAEQASLDLKLNLLKSRLPLKPRVTITYFRPDERKQGGVYVAISGTVTKIREHEGKLIMDDGLRIAFDDILEITDCN